MKNKYHYLFLTIGLVHLTACGSITALTDAAETGDLNDVSSESQVETAFASLVESLGDNSGSANSDDVSSSSSSTGFQASGDEPDGDGESEEGGESEEESPPSEGDDDATTTSTRQERHRVRCDDVTTASESFSCDNTTGNMTRTVEFTDCVVSNEHFEFTLNGSFTNSVENGGDGLCDLGFVNFPSMVMGFGDLNAVHSHTTLGDGLVRTFTTRDGKSATITDESSRTATFYDAIDSDEDGAAEEVTVEVLEEKTITHEIGEDTRVVKVFTTADGFAALDAEGASTDIATSLPLHTLTFEDGKVATRNILSGELIADHEEAGFRLVFGVGDEGLLFDETDDSCGPESGTMTVTGYEIAEDGSIGSEIGTGSITFADGTVESATFDGASLDIKPRPCK